MQKHGYILGNCIVYNLFVNDSLLLNLIYYRLVVYNYFNWYIIKHNMVQIAI